MLGRLVDRHAADRDQVRVVLPGALAGITAAFDSSLVAAADEAALTAPIVATIRGQQLALASALLRGLNPDAPTGLSKVTATH